MELEDLFANEHADKKWFDNSLSVLKDRTPRERRPGGTSSLRYWPRGRYIHGPAPALIEVSSAGGVCRERMDWYTGRALWS